VERGEIENPSALVRAALAHDSALQIGLTLTYDDLTQREYVALEILHEERARARANEQKMSDIRRDNLADAKPLSF